MLGTVEDLRKHSTGAETVGAIEGQAINKTKMTDAGAGRLDPAGMPDGEE